MLWQSEKAVVVGKHQNAMAEINHRFVYENSIAVCRRISGGGTVYHDFGNVNFTYIRNVKSTAEISFKLFTEPVVKALAKLRIEANTSGRNDLLVHGLKISGNAQHVFKNRVLHHGTLLFNSDLKNLGQAITVVPGKYESKAVQSNRSPVANILPFLKTPMNIEEFIKFLLNVQLENPENRMFTLSENDIQTTAKLADEKFRTWEWNFGYSPKYAFSNQTEIDGKILSIRLVVEKGIIVEANLSGEYLDDKEKAELQVNLINKKHFFKELKAFFHSELKKTGNIHEIFF